MSSRVAVFVLLLAAFATTVCQAFRAPLPLSELIGRADAVVAGVISEVGESTFKLEIEGAPSGEIDGSIEIRKFAAPVENPRWADYAPGQRIVVFLVRRPRESPRPDGTASEWAILGRLGEGEIALEGDWAYFHRRYVTTLSPDYYTFHGQTSYLQRVARDILLDAIRSYRACFDWPPGPPGDGRPALACSLSALCALRDRSPLHAFLLEETDEIRERRPKP